jgi:hypothetical protein
LAEQEIKPHKLRYYLERRDPEFEPKMAEILCVYRQVAMLRAEGENIQDQDGAGGDLAIVSYDTTAPDRPPLPGTSPNAMRDHEYKRHGILTLMAGIDLLTDHAQRDLFEEMLIDSALRAGDAETAKRLLTERLERRPRNAWGWCHLAAALDALGERDGASAASATAAELRQQGNGWTS